ncbi:MAG: squalene/phytoene synthase family protein [Pseudomonadota bacterium]
MLRPTQLAPFSPLLATELLAGLEPYEDDHLATLPYVPAHKRAGCLAIIAISAELAALPGRVSDPMLGAIRLQWWREVVEELRSQANPRRHPLVDAFKVLSIPPQARFWKTVSMMIDETSIFLEPVSVMDGPSMLAAAMVHEGARARLLADWLAPEMHAERTDGLAKLAGLYAFARARRWADGAGGPPPEGVEGPAHRLARAWAQDSQLAQGLPLASTLWSQGTPWPPALAPVVAPYKWTGSMLTGTQPSALHKQLSLFLTVMRGR